MLDVGVKVRQNTYKIPLQDITDIFNKILALINNCYYSPNHHIHIYL